MAPISAVSDKISFEKMKKVVGSKADKCRRRFSNSAGKIQLIYEQRFREKRRYSTSSPLFRRIKSPSKSDHLYVPMSPNINRIYSNKIWSDNLEIASNSNPERKYYTLNSR